MFVSFALVSASQTGSFISIFAATKVNRMLRQYLGPGGALEGTLDRGENRQNLTLFKKENARFATLLKQKTFLWPQISLLCIQNQKRKRQNQVIFQTNEMFLWKWIVGSAHIDRSSLPFTLF